MAGPLIATKMFVPTLRRSLVARTRLLDRVRRGADSRLTLLSAPAGFGKTTLLADWVHDADGEDRCVAWLSLDASDHDPASFWTYVVSALHAAAPDVGGRSLELISSLPMPTELVLTALLNELAGAPHDVWLVLDDYHLVDNHDVSEAMTFLITHLPPHVHVVLSTRADPDLPLARWRARGELVEIRAADLRFTLDEAAEYLGNAAGLPLTAADVETLEERTEGWIAALQLAALSIQGRDDVSGFLAQFAGTDRYILDYLVEEVLAQQPEPVRQFLLQSAILDRLTGPLCDAVVERGDSPHMLMTVERANLFLVALDDRREWFRYHHLFAGALRARMLTERPDLVPLLHERASRWYEAHNFTDEAISHALAAQDFDRTVSLIELAVPDVRRHRQEAVLLRWLQVLPDDAVRSSPVLSVFSGYALMLSGDLDGFEGWLDDADRAMASQPAGTAPPWAQTEELRTLPATIAVYRASLAQARGDVTGTAEHARRALELAGPGDHLARGGAAGFIGLAAWAQGDVSTALEIFAQAVASLHAGGNLVDELSSTLVLADMWLAAGRPSTARRLYLRALQVSDAHGGAVLRATADLHVGLSELDYEAGDLGAAREHLEQASELGDGAAMTESRFRWYVAMARLTAAEGDPREAIALLESAERIYRPGFLPDVRPLAALKARVWIGLHDLTEVADWVHGRGLSTTDEAVYLREFDHLTLVRFLIARHPNHSDSADLSQALQLLTRLHDAADASGRAGSLLEIRMLTALAQDAQGHRAQALETLRRSWAHAPEPDAYVRLFLDEGSPMREMLAALTLPGVADDHAHRLLNLAAAPPEVTTDPARDVAQPSDPLSERELQVLRLLDSDLTGPQIARELFVTVNTLRSHTKRIFTKLDVTSRRAAVHRARERGLL